MRGPERVGPVRGRMAACLAAGRRGTEHGAGGRFALIFARTGVFFGHSIGSDGHGLFGATHYPGTPYRAKKNPPTPRIFRVFQGFCREFAAKCPDFAQLGQNGNCNDFAASRIVSRLAPNVRSVQQTPINTPLPRKPPKSTFGCPRRKVVANPCEYPGVSLQNHAHLPGVRSASMWDATLGICPTFRHDLTIIIAEWIGRACAPALPSIVEKLPLGLNPRRR
ncbi:MAG: hypothetical protein AB7F35_21930 [Acetobacteraceae bacterium]